MTLDSHVVRLVSYYRAADVIEGRLQTPTMDPRLSGMRPRAELLLAHEKRADDGHDEVLLNDPLATHHYQASTGYQFFGQTESTRNPDINNQLGYPGDFMAVADTWVPMFENNIPQSAGLGWKQ